MQMSKRIIRIRERHQMRELFQDEKTPAFKRLTSVNEQETKPRGVFKCAHGRHYFTTCFHCKRDVALAQAWESYYMDKLADN